MSPFIDGIDYDDDANDDGIKNYGNVHGQNDGLAGEYGPRWDPQFRRFAKWSRQLAHTMVPFTFQWAEVSHSFLSCCNDDCNHRSGSSQSSMAVIHEEQIQKPTEPKIDGRVKTYYPPTLETIAQHLILLS